MARAHVEEIRRTKFSIGGEPNPLTEDLHQAVKNLSAELYAKDVHFLMELIQNAEDNEYPEGVDPSLQFVITSKDITQTGAPATLLVFNNEKGFSPKNIDSICSVGRSTKKGLRKRGYIGEKGIGFKSVFLITSQPFIFSNGYKIKFNERPCPHCNVGYIVPEWVEENPTLSAIKDVYGSSTTLPTTTLVLPLKPEKVKPVKDQLSTIHPEVLLFLSKIKRLSVREDNDDLKLNTVSAISISSEKDFVTRKNIDAESYTLHLTADDISDELDRECGYYMWKQRFPVKKESKVEVRNEVEEWVITLAFPFGKRLNRGVSLPGIYSFLPTETVTNFPFIIQADFLLASSRENILWDSRWNQGILDCVPKAFLDAFTTLVKSKEDAPVSSLPNLFRFLPLNASSHSKLNDVRDAIKGKLMNESIVPCESYTTQKLFCKPSEVGRLVMAFWKILERARSQGVSFDNISSHGTYLLASSFDRGVYSSVLNFLEIEYVDCEWYAKCIGGSNLVKGVSEDVYLELLVFIAENWGSFRKTKITNIQIVKYVGLDGNLGFFTINEVSQGSGTNKLLAAGSQSISWLIKWNKEFRYLTGRFFLPETTLKATESCSKKQKLMEWLKDDVKVKVVTVCEYAEHLRDSLNSNRNLVVAYAHFLYHSLQKKYLWDFEVQPLCQKMPIVDNYGQVTTRRNEVLVPANGSKWIELIGSNPWRQQNYVELGEDYLHRASYFGIVTKEKELGTFLQEYVNASDIPYLSPPNATIPTVSSPLTKKNALLLLKWLCILRQTKTSLPNCFLSSIKNGSWLKITLSGSPGHRPPSESFLLDSSSGSLLQNGSVLVDIPLIDLNVYGQELEQYREELQMIGVRFEVKEACEFIGTRLMSLAESSRLTRDNVFAALNFIKYLRENCLSPKNFINSIKGGKWLRTSRGEMAPSGSVLQSREWNAASEISDIPFIDQDYYGKEVVSFKRELELLGVVVKFDHSYKIVLNHLKSSWSIASLSSDAIFLILKCIQMSTSYDNLVQLLQGRKCLKTNLGYRCPSECFLSNPESEWGCLLQVFSSFPILDEKFYGKSIFLFTNELKKLGVMVDFEDASKEFVRTFKQQALYSSVTKENVLSFLSCYRKLKNTNVKFPSELKNCIRDEKWLRTRLGDYRSPKECILFGSEWESIFRISLLPFLDDSDKFYGIGIHDYRAELKLLGVVMDFKDGAKFVAAGLFLPQECSSLTPANVFALLDSIKNLKGLEKDEPILASFQTKLSRNWIKTRFGFLRPDQCLLFDSAWNPFLKPDDGPFIDDQFYGPRIASYSNELNRLGVTVDVKKGCILIASDLGLHSSFEAIGRIYNYLSEFKWEPEDKESRKIWIPRGTDNGEWVTPEDCVLHDKTDLFGDQLYVLEKFEYEKKVLEFFANVFSVKVHPSVDDYCKLWKLWESLGHRLSNPECCAFWEFVVCNWNSKTEDTFCKNLIKLPVLDPTSEGISLVDKRDVIIGDDLFLMDLFRSSSRPIFIWYPEPSPKAFSRLKLVDVYSKLGVRKLSESAQKDVSDIDDVGFNPVDPREMIIKRGLFKLILGVLADPGLKLEAKRRHEVVSRLVGVKVFETIEPMRVRYSLSFTCGDVVEVEARRMIRWDKQNLRFFMQKMEGSSGCKSVLEYATHFAEVVAEGVLWENEDVVPRLVELIRLGFMVEFDEEAVEFLMKIKNLEIFMEDQNYLSSTFSSQ